MRRPARLSCCSAITAPASPGAMRNRSIIRRHRSRARPRSRPRSAWCSALPIGCSPAAMPAAGAAADSPSRPCSARPQADPAEKTMNRAGLIIALAIAAVVGVVFGLYPQLDLMIAAPFHDISLRGNPFGLRIYPPLLLARDIGLWVGTAVIVPVVAALVLKLLLPRRRLLLSGRAILFLMTTIALGPGLLANAVLKEHWDRPRPIEVTQFGGTEHFVAWWDPRGECDKNCSFVSGDVAGAFWTIAPATSPDTN